jgi:ribonucleotide reductase class II
MILDLTKLAVTSATVFYRTYSRWLEVFNRRETWSEVIDRCIKGFADVGKLNDRQLREVSNYALDAKVMPSGRWLWVGGSDWVKIPANFYGAYNCNSTAIDSFEAIAHVMDLLMQGCGVGVMLESKFIEQLPPVINKLQIQILDLPIKAKGYRQEETSIEFDNDNKIFLIVGDSRKGWVEALYQILNIAALNLSLDSKITPSKYKVFIDLSNIRPDGDRIKGFGGIAKSKGLGEFFIDVADILNQTKKYRLSPKLCALLICTIGKVVVAGNVRRSAIIEQFDYDNEDAQTLKKSMWRNVNGVWSIDPKIDCMRMANLTRVFHKKPTLKECIDSVTSQYHSGEGAIQWTGEAIARASADLLDDMLKKQKFLDLYNQDKNLAANYLRSLLVHNKFTSGYNVEVEINDRMLRYGLNPCGEIIQFNNFCNLSEVHLNTIDPFDLQDQEKAFEVAALSVCVLLHHDFNKATYQQSRELDPIVGVSFTGLFDFFVHAFGVDWLRWWEQGRCDNFNATEYGWSRISMVAEIFEPSNPKSNFQDCKNASSAYRHYETLFLKTWQSIATKSVKEYCESNDINTPNRCTTVQPAGTKSLLTGASPGWHPPVSQRYIRRITFAAYDPVALACIDYGYSVIPSQKDKDEHGDLLNDAFDPRCTEWLIEIPTQVSWADLPGADRIDIAQFSAVAQMDFYMSIQKHYTQHNTSATLLFRESEITALATRIFEAIANDEGYISVAMLARFDDYQNFPRLPFEPIDFNTYNNLQESVLSKRALLAGNKDFGQLLSKYDTQEAMVDAGCAPCDSEKCDIVLS